MTPTRFTCTLTCADESACQSYARVTIVDAEGVTARGGPRHAVAASIASPAPASTGPTPRASTSGSARPWSWPKSEASSAKPGRPGTITMAASPSPATPLPSQILSRPG
jgi:hypothetical protein